MKKVSLLQANAQNKYVVNYKFKMAKANYMRKSPFSPCINFSKIAFLALLVCFFVGNLKAQSLATWTMNKTDQYKPTLVSANVTALPFLPDANFGVNFSTNGFRLKPATNWPSSVPTTDSFFVDFPISPTAGNDITISSINFNIPSTSISTGVSFVMTPYFKIDGQGGWIPFASAQTVSKTSTSASFNGLNQPLYSSHTYVIRMYINSTVSGTKNSSYFYLMNAVFSGTTTTASVKPSVKTSSATKSIITPKYAGTVTGLYDFNASLVNGGFQLISQSGVCWNTTGTPDATLSTKTTDGNNGTINDVLSNLIAGTTYNVRTYAVTQFDTIYGAQLSFTTDSPSIPTVTTVAASNVLSNKATSGGTISDSGGVAIIQEGVCWSTTQGAETATSGTNFTSDGTSSNNYISSLLSLQSLTTYYLKAYAKNSIGVAYGNEITFTTAAPVPIINASSTTLTFPTVLINSTPKVLSYSLSGTNLSPASDTIKIIPPLGFSISTSQLGIFSTDSLLLPYSKNKLPSTTIYVRQLTSNFTASSGIYILHSGGGASNPYIDTVFLSGNVIQDPTVLTNLGTDFWVGHGLEEHMSNKSGYGLQLYIATGGQSATVKVSIPGIPSFAPQYFTIDTNSVQIVSGFPTGDLSDPKNAKGLPDARLYFTGISNRGIHVEVTNNVPVALFLYDYATNNSAGGSMVFPTNTWNNSYIVQTYGGATSNTGLPNTYFFVMAKEDNTLITFKPTAPIIDSASSPVVFGKVGGTIAYDSSTTTGYQIVLNKGQVFNAVGMVDASKIGLDLTGTTVTSDCYHPISVFAGNSRTLINAPGLNCTPNSGSDNLIQQMFPKVAWGTKYLTVPTKSMEYNVFRIGLQDTSTIVTVDDSILDKSNLNTIGMYYEIEGNTNKMIVSDKPVTVTQFIISGGKNTCGTPTVGNNGGGDPEMILLSPLQQSIKTTTVYTSGFKDDSTGGAYINVVIPTRGVSSFRLDLSSNPTQMVDTGASSYTGLPYDTAALIPIAQAFSPFSQDSSYSWAKFHVSYPTVHTLSSDVGFNAIAYGVAGGESWGYNAGTTINDLTAVVTTSTQYGSAPSATTCKGNTAWINVSLPYDPSKVDSIQWVSSSDPSVIPSNDTTYTATTDGHVVTSGSYTRGGQTFYTFKSPKNYTFYNLGTFKFTLTLFGTFANECGGTKTFNVVMTVLQDTANFSALPVNCGSASFNFRDITKPIFGDTITKWQWSFGTPNNDSSYVQNPTLVFPATANYLVKLRAINNIGCFTDTSKKVSVVIAPTPTVAFSAPDSICIPTGDVTFVNNTTTSIPESLTYLWNFGDGIGSSTNKSPAYNYNILPPTPTGFKVKLTATSVAGCKDSATHILAVATPPAHSHITSSLSSNSILIGQQITLTEDTNNGIWVNTDGNVASLDSLGNTAKVKGVTKGSDIILYILPSDVCKSDTASFPLTVDASDVFIPNLFSPNGDGHNDIFYIRGSSALYKEAELWVFSSWGNQVFHRKGSIDDTSAGWDGTYNGLAQPTGTYVYVAVLTELNGNVITKKGSITLIR